MGRTEVNNRHPSMLEKECQTVINYKLLKLEFFCYSALD